MRIPCDLRKNALFVSGHRACPGCGIALAVRHILKAAGKNVIVVTPTGCLETFSSPYGYSPWRVPWIHHLFENGASVATGVAAALRAQKKEFVRVLVIAGDGATFDIGFGALSGLFERGDDVLYICTDNEAYMNTGGQRSGATPIYAATTTHPAGKNSYGKTQLKKDLPAIAAAHGALYVARASLAFPLDIQKKVKKAMGFRGSRYLQINTPCPAGWGFPSDQTLEIARKGIACGLVPLFEIKDGEIMNVRKIKKKTPITQYLRPQARFKHLFLDASGKKELSEIQALADRNIEKYDL